MQEDRAPQPQPRPEEVKPTAKDDRPPPSAEREAASWFGSLLNGSSLNGAERLGLVVAPSAIAWAGGVRRPLTLLLLFLVYTVIWQVLHHVSGPALSTLGRVLSDDIERWGRRRSDAESKRRPPTERQHGRLQPPRSASIRWKPWEQGAPGGVPPCRGGRVAWQRAASLPPRVGASERGNRFDHGPRGWDRADTSATAERPIGFGQRYLVPGLATSIPAHCHPPKGDAT